MRRLDHEFVDVIPEKPEPGRLYVCMQYATAVHLCCCGCGREVVTPLSPAQWRMSFDGESVSLHPSIGNWSLPCRSHYVIRNGRVLTAGRWTDEEIEQGRSRDRRARDRLFMSKEASAQPIANSAQEQQSKGWIRNFLRVVNRRR